MVIKDSLYEEEIATFEMTKKFQEGFCKTQKIASNQARKFNKELEVAGVPLSVPRVEFAHCSVYQVDDDRAKRRYFWLAEKQLETAGGVFWEKWNDNQGGVQGMKKTEERKTKVRFSMEIEIINPEDAPENNDDQELEHTIENNPRRNSTKSYRF